MYINTPKLPLNHGQYSTLSFSLTLISSLPYQSTHFPIHPLVFYISALKKVVFIAEALNQGSYIYILILSELPIHIL